MTAQDDAGLAILVLGQPQFTFAGRPFKFAASRKALALVGEEPCFVADSAFRERRRTGATPGKRQAY